MMVSIASRPEQSGCEAIFDGNFFSGWIASDPAQIGMGKARLPADGLRGAPMPRPSNTPARPKIYPHPCKPMVIVASRENGFSFIAVGFAYLVDDRWKDGGYLVRPRRNLVPAPS